MANKINFTAEHKARLDVLAISMLFNNTLIKGLVGTMMTVFDLIHNTTTNTLVSINVNLKKEIEKIESLDEWSMNAYQQKKLAATKELQEFVNLLIGYKKFNEQTVIEKAKIKELQKKYNELKVSAMSPEDQLKALETEIANLGGSTTAVEEEDEFPDMPKFERSNS